MSLIKCRRCGEMFSDSYKTCPFCEEDDAYYGGRVKKRRSRRAEVVEAFRSSALAPRVTFSEERAGLHFLEAGQQK